MSKPGLQRLRDGVLAEVIRVEVIAEQLLALGSGHELPALDRAVVRVEHQPVQFLLRRRLAVHLQPALVEVIIK
jgi:hypothetical protein